MQNMVGFRPVYVEIIRLSFDVFFVSFCISKYFPLLPLKFPSPRSLNPSKIIFLIIKTYIVWLYIKKTRVPATNFFDFFVNQELRKTRPCSFKPHHEIIFPTNIRTPPTTAICMRILVGNINRKY